MTTRLPRVLAGAALVGVAFGTTAPAATANESTEPLRAVVSTTTTADVDVAALSDPIENLALVAPTRLAGSDRFGTAVEISKRAFTPSTARTVYLVGGSRTDEALAGSALTDGPVLLVPSTGTVPASVRAEIARLAPSQVVALGGARSVSATVLGQAAQGRPTARLGSDDVYATATAIARRAFPNGSPRVYLARVGGSPDALVGGALPDGPVLPVPATGAVPASIRSYITSAGPRQVTALGGRSAISDAVLSASAVNATTSRLAGADRFSTAAAVAHAAFPQGSSVAYLASGGSLADAVVGGTLTDGPILLAPPVGHAQISAGVGNALTRLRVSNVGTLGGPAALSDAAVRNVAQNAPAVSIGVLPAYVPIAGTPTSSPDPAPTPAPRPAPAPAPQPPTQTVAETCASLVPTFRPIPMHAGYTISCVSNIDGSGDTLGQARTWLTPDGAFARGEILIRSDMPPAVTQAVIAHELAHGWSYAYMTPAQRQQFARLVGQSSFTAGTYDDMPAEIWARSQARCAGYPDGYNRREVGCDVLVPFGWRS